MTSLPPPVAPTLAVQGLDSVAPSLGGRSTFPPEVPLAQQVQHRFSQFRAMQPGASLTVSLAATLPQGNGTEYIVLAALAVEGQVLGSSLASGPSVAIAQAQAQWQTLSLLGLSLGATGGMTGGAIAQPIAQPISTTAAQPSETQPGPMAPSGLAAPPLDDGLGDTAISFGEALDEPEPAPLPEQPPASKPKPKPKTKQATSPTAADLSDATETGSFAQASADESAGESAETLPRDRSAAEASSDGEAPDFVDDWSDDLAQIAVELKRLSWTAQQERDYLQRTYGKISRDDITDHNELLDYLIYLQALPSPFDGSSDSEAEAIAEASLSVDAADLAPQSLSELMASTGLRPASAIGSESPAPAASPSPPPKPEPAVAGEQPAPEAAEPDLAPAISGAAAPESAAPESAATLTPLSRKEMMDETARLCRQLGWKNRQGSEFLQGQYGKATRMDLSDAELEDFLEQLRSLSPEESLPY